MQESDVPESQAQSHSSKFARYAGSFFPDFRHGLDYLLLRPRWRVANLGQGVRF